MVTCHSLLKSFLFFSLLLSISFAFTSCGDNHETASSLVATAPAKPVVEPIKESDKHFLVQAAEVNLQEIMLAKLAQRRTGNEELRAMAKMFEEAHRTAKSNLTAIASRKSVAIPTEATAIVTQAYDTLNSRSVTEFDQQYCFMMIQSHKNAIHLFESYTIGQNDTEIASWALALLPELRFHLSKAQELDAHMNPLSELVRE